MLSTQLMAAVLAVSGVGETVLLDFQAEWCGPCKAMDPVVKRVQLQGYPVRKVNIDQQKALAAQYGVNRIPCFVLLVNGQERARKIGEMNDVELRQMFKIAGVSPRTPTAGRSPRRPFFSRPQKSSAPVVPQVEIGEVVDSTKAGLTAPPPSTAPSRPQPTLRSSPQPNPPPRRDRLVTLPRHVPPARPAAIERNVSGDSLAEKLRTATVRLKVEDQGGHSFGSGTIIYYGPAAGGRGDEALVLTCGHIFRQSGGKGAILVELFDKGRPRGLLGRLVKYDVDRDIGLVAVQTNGPVPVAQLASPKTAKPGDKVISIGCDHGRDPTVQRSHVMAINNFVGPENLQVAGQPAVGRSGGGVFNARGQLIGVCNFADPTDRAGLYAAVSLAREVIAQAGLANVLASGPGLVATAAPPRRAPPAMPATMPMPGFAEVQRGGRDENRRTEIICIVDSGKEKREVIIIDDASADLLQKLAVEQQRQQGTYPTSMDVSRDQTPDHPSLPGVIRTTTDWQPRWR